MDAGWFALKEAKLYTMATGRPRMIVSAFGPQAARIAGKYGDGLWTMGDPEIAEPVIEAYRSSCSEHGKEVGEIVLQSGFHLAADEEAAIASTVKWKATQLSEVYRDDIPDPAEMRSRAEREVTDQEFAKEGFIVASDPAEHVERLREICAIDGATAICLQLIGNEDPMGSIRRYGEAVLPALRR
jgi:coenzyme F420-dependent glucose-6-phosphate dehydrogenase